MKIHNAVILLLIKRKNKFFILTVTHAKTKLVGLPGGRIDAKDGSAYAAAKREYREETGNVFPKVKILAKLLWCKNKKSRTMIFIVSPQSNVYISDKLGKNADGEMIDLNIRSVYCIKRSLEGKTSWKIRLCERASLKQIFKHLQI